MQATKFAIPEIIFGRGSIIHVAQCAKRLGAKRVLLISDTGVERSGWVERVMDILRENSVEWVYFNEVNSNPRDYQVYEGFEVYTEAKADVIIAIGGGSPIDAAKGIAILAGNGGRINDYEGANRVMRPLPPMVYLPTTAGSGSDMSQFCIITDVARQLKMSIISRSLVPNISIIDPLILLTKSQELIIASAVDAFSHAVESYVSRIASPFTTHQALLAINLIIPNLMRAVEDRSIEALEQLSIASTAAGMSFSNAGLGAAHALAHSLGGMFDVLHGLVHPVLLPEIMRFNTPACPEKMGTIGRCIIGDRKCPDEVAALEGIERLQEFFTELAVPVRLRDILPDQSSFERLAGAAVGDACNLTNPRTAGKDDFLAICERAW
ncbi:iron-containing alcohol dehydrogenase [Desulfovibrio sp. X2]|uniref:iron-containing alcohol dehydrogenase n=1 Tax=Desulfovibrio sp. X2 TaxID=941449 RepID=UPI000358CB66|nr:iron-containing alcohol dehydrogenase [Desulfovibrio sp. X2]EPR44351.1 iron-containing alcohol dehydrogenase [Desulfovibrio sp. X2]